MNAELINLADRVTENVDAWRHKATMLAFINPIGFFVVYGTTLPAYLAKLNELEATFKKVKEKLAS